MAVFDGRIYINLSLNLSVQNFEFQIWLKLTILAELSDCATIVRQQSQIQNDPV